MEWDTHRANNGKIAQEAQHCCTQAQEVHANLRFKHIILNQWGGPVSGFIAKLSWQGAWRQNEAEFPLSLTSAITAIFASSTIITFASQGLSVSQQLLEVKEWQTLCRGETLWHLFQQGKTKNENKNDQRPARLLITRWGGLEWPSRVDQLKGRLVFYLFMKRRCQIDIAWCWKGRQGAAQTLHCCCLLKMWKREKAAGRVTVLLKKDANSARRGRLHWRSNQNMTKLFNGLVFVWWIWIEARNCTGWEVGRCLRREWGVASGPVSI